MLSLLITVATSVILSFAPAPEQSTTSSAMGEGVYAGTGGGGTKGV